jgi:hypothetical protein
VSCIAFVSGTYFVEYCYEKNAPKIKIEAVAPTAVHPISGEFSTGFVLVEIWTTTDAYGYKVDVPNIVRMPRSEYIEYMKSLK